MTMSAPAPVVLDDLTHPTFAPEVEEIRDVMRLMASDCRLDLESLKLRAVTESGLDDFGPRDYEARLAVLLEAVASVPGLNDPGRVNLHAQFVQMLRNRLQLTDVLKRNPAIAEIELEPPVVIVGLPRTGTTHLHNLLSSTATFRTMPYWESVEPIPRRDEADLVPDPRIERAEQALQFANAAMPHFLLMHEMAGADHVHEEIQLLANDFSSMYFETLADLPGWRDYYLAHDQTPHYAHLALQLKAMQFLRGGRRWLLKTPQHLEQLPVLDRVFPGLTTVITHRDPVAVVVSLAHMIAYTARMHRDPVPAEQLGQAWADRITVMLDQFMLDRDLLDPERSIDVRFDDFVADNLAVVERVYDAAGEDLDNDAHRSIQEYVDSHQRGHLGTIQYDAAQVGLDIDELRERFAPYVERFVRA